MTQFNEQQQHAVNFFEGACGVISSAGSGKTTTLLGRIQNLINQHKVSERDLLVISFTKATASELTKKLASMGYNFVNVGTFHAICGKILAKEGIYITGQNLVKEWQIDNCFKAIDKNADTLGILDYISYQKNYMKSYTDDFVYKDSVYSEDELRTFFKAYEDMKEKQRLYDFDDYLLLCLQVLRDNPNKYTFKYILVDEHQDSNKVQNLLLKEWCQSGNIFTLSDFRQAIYSWRGGNVEYSMNFENYWDNAKIINMHINYRSPRNIVENANTFIRNYYGKYKHYIDAEAHNQSNGHIQINSHFGRDVEGVEVVDKIEQLITDGVELNEIAVLYRLNKHADYVESELKRRNIEYDIANDSSFFKRNEVAGIIAYLRLIQNLEDDNAFTAIFKLRNYPLGYFSNKLFSDIQKYANDNDVSLFEALQEISYPNTWQRKNAQTFVNKIEALAIKKDQVNVITLINEVFKSFRLEDYIVDKYSNKQEREERLDSVEVLKSFVKGNNLEQFITYVYSNTNKKKTKKDAVRLMTIHRSKGLEFDNVFLIGVEDEQFPDRRADIEEEARLFYVGVTRSKKNLWISEIGRDNLFIKEYGKDHVQIGDSAGRKDEEDKGIVSDNKYDVLHDIEESLSWIS